MGFRNLHLGERWLRLAIAIGLLSVGWSVEAETWSWTIALRIIALYPLLTGFLGWCPVKSLLASAGPSRGKHDGEGKHG